MQKQVKKNTDTNLEFIKYQSLGNDFVLFDWLNNSEQNIQEITGDKSFSAFVSKLCDRHFGIGADGIIILKKITKNMPEMLIYNADGSQAEICLNGLRCVAHYLYTQNKQISFEIMAGPHTAHCTIAQDNPEDLSNIQIITALPISKSAQNLNTCPSSQSSQNNLEPIIAQISQARFAGYPINIGNPHFIILQKTTSEWLDAYGKELEQHKLFPQKTNVEFVWQQDQNTYNVLVYERGCGRTLACGSGAVAITTLFYLQEKIKSQEKITLIMQGGSLTCWVENNQVFLQAPACPVFTGTIFK
ncbi:MAG: diaminopimelate epimerase [bacterium]